MGVRFDWDAAFGMQRKYGWGELTSNLLLVGQRDQTTPIHYDEQDNLFCQLTGHKRVVSRRGMGVGRSGYRRSVRGKLKV